MKDLHVLIVDDTNIENIVSNSLYIGKIDSEGNKYASLKDAYGDSINLRDDNTQDIEDMICDIFSVSPAVNFTGNPKIIFQVSNQTTPRAILEDLQRKFMATKEEIKIHKEIVQINSDRYELVPFVTAHGCYTELVLNESKDKTMNENIRTLLTSLWYGYDAIIMALWETYKDLANLFTSLALSTSKQFSDIVFMDIEVIETKIRIDNLRNSMGDIDWVEKKWIKTTFDLREHNLTRLFKLNVNSLNTDKATIGKWFIIQESPINNDLSQSGIAIIEILRSRVIDFKQTAYECSGVKIIPVETKDNRFPLIALHGGARYHIYRTPGGTVALDKTVTEITDEVNKNKTIKSIKSFSTIASEDIQVGGDKLYLLNTDSNKCVRLKITKQ